MLSIAAHIIMTFTSMNETHLSINFYRYVVSETIGPIVKMGKLKKKKMSGQKRSTESITIFTKKEKR